MATLKAHPALLDRLAIGLSALCLVHCLGTAVALGLLSAAGGFLALPVFHEAGLLLAMLFGLVAIGRGFVRHRSFVPAAVGALGIGMMAGAMTLGHGSAEIVATMAGVAVLALGHDLNRRAVV